MPIQAYAFFVEVSFVWQNMVGGWVTYMAEFRGNINQGKKYESVQCIKEVRP